ncbi:MAG TPA: bifunctional phosphopantothenoylcysteine decarboxylase/phosphopantothenate--cysteine ligase CoaBC [Thermomicrobiales bacterium]
MGNLRESRILLGVTGGIAAYKAADLASKLVQAGARVDVIATRSALRLVGPATFEALTKRPVHVDVFESWTEDYFGHISLGHEADAFVVAPATAHTIARLALGLADDMLTTVALSTTAPLVIAPAMEHSMFHHPAMQGHLATLRQRGATIVGPDRGRLASGAEGDGRLAPVETIVGALRQVLGQRGPLVGCHVVVTAGGTHEPLDPVRFIGNASSGLMGYALAQAAIDAGARVTLISGPTHLTPPYGADLVAVQSALDMERAVHDAVERADALIMAAAVADFRPRDHQPAKIKKGQGQEPLALELVRNPDILASVNRPGLVKIGFAAETENLIEHARAKLQAKGLAMIVANDAAATIGSRTSAAVLISADGTAEPLPLMPKEELAEIIIGRLAQLLRRSHDAASG